MRYCLFFILITCFTNCISTKVFNDLESRYAKIKIEKNILENSEDSLQQSLDKLDIKDDHPPASMFERGTNVDERNIMFSTKRLLEKGSKTKLLAVLSDGMTRGSLNDLKSSINYATKVGIDVIGIGIGERGTWKEYINKTQINQPEELIHSIVNITKDILIKNIEESTGVA